MRKISILFLFAALVFVTACKNEATFRETKPFAKYSEFPINSIEPRGWIRVFLENQKNGLTGHLENAKYPFDSIWWGKVVTKTNTSASQWWPYEQNGYWLDGMMRVGYLLNDTFLINKARRQTDWVIAHPDSGIYLGPHFMKASNDMDRWANAVFFRSLQAEYSATQNKDILKALTKHFSDRFPHTAEREAVNIETILWLYSQTKENALLPYAEKIYHDHAIQNKSGEICPAKFMTDKPTECHGVTYNELAKIGAILYMYTGKNEYLQASIAAFKKLDKYHMMVDGVNVSSEHIHTPPSSLQVHETCDISDFIWSSGYMLMATGDASYADKIEKAAFNAAPSVVTSNFKALQYFSGPNQVLCAKNSSHSIQDAGGQGMSFRPNPFTECCPGNVNRMLPNFVTRMWLDDGNYGVVAAMYGPSALKTKLGQQQNEVSIEEITRYPFSDTIIFSFSMKKAASFPFTLRIPSWCTSASLQLNGKVQAGTISRGHFLTINREFKNGDKIMLVLPQKLKLSHWPDKSIAVEKGPLVFSLKIEEDWKIDTTEKRATKDFPAYNLYPKSPWNYALCLDSLNLEKEAKIIYRKPTDSPWSIDSAPIEIIVPAKRIDGWVTSKPLQIKREKWVAKPEGKKVVWIHESDYWEKGNFEITPSLPDPTKLPSMLSKSVEYVTLVPYGSSKLRITLFPVAKR